MKAAEAIFRPAMILMTGRGLGFIVAFAIPMVLARVFDQAEFGSYKQLFLIYATLFGIAQVGMAESLYYFLPFERERQGAYIANTLLVLAGLGAIALLGLYLCRDVLAQFLNNPEIADYIPLIGVTLLLMLLAVVLEIIMTISKQHYFASVTYALSDLIRASFFILPVLIFAEISYLLYGAIAFALTRLVSTLFYLRRQFRGELTIDMPLMRKHLAYAVPFGIAGLIEMLQLNFHLYAVSYYFDVATFAIYAVGCLQVPLIDFMMTSTSNVMMINMREKMLDGDRGAVVSIWLDSIRKLAMVFFPLVLLLMLLAQQLIVLLFTSTYERSVPVFMVWTASMLFSTLLTDGVLRVFAETRFLILQNLLRLMIIASLIHWFLMRFDLIGAVMVTLLATVLIKIFALARIKKILQVNLAQLLPWQALLRTLLITLTAAIPAILIKQFVELPDLAMLLTVSVTFCLSYGLLLLHYGPLQEDEKKMLKFTVMKPVRRLMLAVKA